MLLFSYEDIWKELHSQTASSCRQAQVCNLHYGH